MLAFLRGDTTVRRGEDLMTAAKVMEMVLDGIQVEVKADLIYHAINYNKYIIIFIIYNTDIKLGSSSTTLD